MFRLVRGRLCASRHCGRVDVVVVEVWDHLNQEVGAGASAHRLVDKTHLRVLCPPATAAAINDRVPMRHLMSQFLVRPQQESLGGTAAVDPSRGGAVSEGGWYRGSMTKTKDIMNRAVLVQLLLEQRYAMMSCTAANVDREWVLHTLLFSRHGDGAGS
jgi:hypothetical protein